MATLTPSICRKRITQSEFEALVDEGVRVIQRELRERRENGDWQEALRELCLNGENIAPGHPNYQAVNERAGQVHRRRGYLEQDKRDVERQLLKYWLPE